jgi:hypothetical protein
MHKLVADHEDQHGSIPVPASKNMPEDLRKADSATGERLSLAPGT